MLLDIPVKAALVLMLAHVLVRCFPEGAGRSHTVDCGLPDDFHPVDQEALCLLQTRGATTLRNPSIPRHSLVDVPDPTPLDEARRSYTSHGLILSAEGRPLRLL